MIDVTRQILQTLKTDFGDSIFTQPKQFEAAISDLPIALESTPVRNLLIYAICNIGAYTRLKQTVGNNPFLIGHLAAELNKAYGVSSEISQIVIACIAELLGCEMSIQQPTIDYRNEDKENSMQIAHTRSTIDVHYLSKIRTTLAKYRSCLAIGAFHAVGLKSDGTVIATDPGIDEGQCQVSHWENIVAVAAGGFHTIGLTADGTVVAVGDDTHGRCNVADWAEIVAVAAGVAHTVGLKADGTMVAAGRNERGQCDICDWTDIIALATGDDHTVGLRSDGTVLATRDNKHGCCDITYWTEIVAIAAGAMHTVGLKADGTVIVVGDTMHGQCDTADWIEIVAIAAGYSHTVGLKADGTVITTSCGQQHQSVVGEWCGIVAISAGRSNTVGLKADGRISVDNNGTYTIADWHGVGLYQPI